MPDPDKEKVTFLIAVLAMIGLGALYLGLAMVVGYVMKGCQ